MSLSLSRRRHDQIGLRSASSSSSAASSSSWTLQKQLSQPGGRDAPPQQPPQRLYIRKQHSFIEAGPHSRSAKPGVPRGFLQRGLSVGRSHDNLRLKDALQRGAAWQQKALDNELKRVDSVLGVARNTKESKSCKGADASSPPSASSSPSLSDDLVSPGGACTTATVGGGGGLKSPGPTPSQPKSDANKINLSIVLSAPVLAVDRDPYSDIDSSSEAVEPPALSKPPAPVKRFGITQVVVESQQLYPIGGGDKGGGSLVAARHSLAYGGQRPPGTLGPSLSGSVTTTTPTTANSPTPSSPSSPLTPLASRNSLPGAVHGIAINSVNSYNNNNNNNNSGSNFAGSPSLTVLRRPPLVRAMSAPVRSDEHHKSLSGGGGNNNNANNRRKFQRRRKLAPPSVGSTANRLAGFEVLPEEQSTSKGDLLLATDKTRVRSAGSISSDIITLVSLISSEGSDSEREDSAAESPHHSGGGQQADSVTSTSPTKRAPLLRKTGKSVSFQENYPPNFQLASKEYSHMIRRSSLARSTRPPTAPAAPVSLYIKDPFKAADDMARLIKDNGQVNADNEGDDGGDAANEAKPKTPADLSSPQMEYNYPDYVKSVKERECWKLFQKMAAKGVNVTYDTVLRGMLTPTEMRQLQKQRDIEEAKARAAEALLNGESEEVAKPPPTAIERLSESLLKK